MGFLLEKNPIEIIILNSASNILGYISEVNDYEIKG